MLDLIHAYETYLTKVKQASDNTVYSYMRDIRQFSEWLHTAENLDVLDATQLNISVYLDHLQQQGKSGATASRTLQVGYLVHGIAGEVEPEFLIREEYHIFFFNVECLF